MIHTIEDSMQEWTRYSMLKSIRDRRKEEEQKKERLIKWIVNWIKKEIETTEKKIKVTLRIFGESSSYRDSRLFALIWLKRAKRKERYTDRGNGANERTNQQNLSLLILFYIHCANMYKYLH